VIREPREQLHGFFASLTIYKLPLHVIYTGLMVMLFRTQTPCRDPLGWRGGGGDEGMCESVKYCKETPPAAANVLRGKRGEWGATLRGRGNAADCSACRQGLAL